ncbi:hypothetical protein ACFLV6_00540 [Chloroflexota bacterium]
MPGRKPPADLQISMLLEALCSLLLSEVCARPIAYKDLRSWDIGEALNIDEEVMKRIWKRLFDSDALRYAPPTNGAISGLSSLSKHEIWLITSRPISTQDLTLAWLHDNRVHYDQLVFNRRGDKLSAGPIFSVFVEDFLGEAITIAKADIFTILFDQPSNQSSKLPRNCKRASSLEWRELLEKRGEIFGFFQIFFQIKRGQNKGLSSPFKCIEMS